MKDYWRDFPGGPMANTVLAMEGGWCSIPGQGARSHMLQLKIPNAAAKIACSQINFLKYF